MATAKVIGTGDRQPSRWRRNLVLAALALGGGVLALSWSGLREEARIGTAYAARVGCTCRYVSNRPLASCKGDIAVAALGRTASLMRLSEDAGARTVSASVPLLWSETATYEPGGGCLLEPWTD